MATGVDTLIRKSAGYSTPSSNVTFCGTELHSYSPPHGSTLPSPTQIDPFYTQGQVSLFVSWIRSIIIFFLLEHLFHLSVFYCVPIHIDNRMGLSKIKD